MKGITIFLVVFGHCIQFGNGTEFDFFGDAVFKVICSFHMPLFALVSGYLFFWSVSSRSPREVLIRQVNNLLLPVFSWTVVSHALRAAIFVYKGDFSGAAVVLLKICSGFLHGLWFLWAMFYASVIVLLVREKLKDSIIVYALILFLLVVLPESIAPDPCFVFVYPYFVAGYIWRREHMDEKFSLEQNKLLCAGIILVWCVMLLFYDRDSYVYTTGTAIFRYRQRMFMPAQLWTDIFRWLIGFAGCGAVLILLKLIKPVKFIAAIGVKSLGIYIISGIIIGFTSWHLFHHLPEQGYIVNFLQAAVLTAVCYALSGAISRVKILNRIFFGGR